MFRCRNSISEKALLTGGRNLLEWTWQSHICFVYDRFSLRLIKQFEYAGEGWGMARTASEIVTSDGSDTLRFRNPETFSGDAADCGEDEGRSVERFK